MHQGFMNIFVKSPDTGFVPEGPVIVPEKFPDMRLLLLAVIVSEPLVPP